MARWRLALELVLVLDLEFALEPAVPADFFVGFISTTACGVLITPAFSAALRSEAALSVFSQLKVPSPHSPGRRPKWPCVAVA